MKDLCLMPARVALAAQADGWWVRSDIIWAKPNPMPESMTDRPTDAYEHILMLTRSGRYFWNAEAVKEQSLSGDIRRPYGSPGAWELDGRSKDKRHGGEPRKNWKTPDGWDTSNGAGGHGTIHRMGREKGHFGYTPKGTHSRGNGDGGPKARARAVEGVHEGWNESTREILETRNMRNVWMFATQPHKGAHFATFPEELPRRCILAASKPGDVILDPFGGSGTTARVAIELQRKPILLDLAYAHDYGPLAKKRTSHVQVQAFV